MKKLTAIVVGVGLVGTAALCAPVPTSGEKGSERWTGNIMCGEQKAGRLLLMDAQADWNDPKAVLWEWSAAQSADIGAQHKKWFSLPTDCKPVLNGSHVIMSASGGAIALIRLADRKVIFYACPGGNTHSVERLPDGNLVSASSD